MEAAVVLVELQALEVVLGLHDGVWVVVLATLGAVMGTDSRILASAASCYLEKEEF